MWNEFFLLTVRNVALTAVLLPYITLHMLQIGITIEEVGIIYAVLPFASCLGPPTAGEFCKSLLIKIAYFTRYIRKKYNKR